MQHRLRGVVESCLVAVERGPVGEFQNHEIGVLAGARVLRELHVGDHELASHQLVEHRIGDVRERLVVRAGFPGKGLIEPDPVHVSRGRLGAQRCGQGAEGKQVYDAGAHDRFLSRTVRVRGLH